MAPRWEHTRKVKRAKINVYRYAVAATLLAALVLGPGLGGVLLQSDEPWRELWLPELMGLIYVGVVSAACMNMYNKIAEVDSSNLKPDDLPQDEPLHSIG